VLSLRLGDGFGNCPLFWWWKLTTWPHVTSVRTSWNRQKDRCTVTE